MSTIRSCRAALIAAAVASLPGLAMAQDAGPRLVGGGENAEVVYGGPNGNVVGGGAASMSGGADDVRIAYGSLVTAQRVTGGAAELVGGGENTQVVYSPVAPSNSMLAGSVGRPRG